MTGITIPIIIMVAWTKNLSGLDGPTFMNVLIS